LLLTARLNKPGILLNPTAVSGEGTSCNCWIFTGGGLVAGGVSAIALGELNQTKPVKQNREGSKNLARMGKNLLTGIGLIKKSRQWDEKEINTSDQVNI
jgi:hypothetical protein